MKSIFIVPLWILLLCTTTKSSAQALPVIDSIAIAERYADKGSSLANNHLFDSAFFYYRKSASIFERRIVVKGDHMHRRFLKVSETVAQVHTRIGDPKYAIELLRPILREARTYFDNQKILADVLKVIGIAYINLGQYDSTEIYYKESLRVSQSIPDFPIRPIGYTLNNLGHLYSITGAYELSKEYHNQAITIRKKLLSQEESEFAFYDLSQSYLNIGNVYYFTGEVETALAYWHKVVDLTARVGDQNLSQAAMALGNLGEVNKELGRLDRALDYGQKSLEIKLRLYGQNHQSTAHAYAALASVTLELGRDDEAHALYQKAIRVQKETLGSKHPRLAEIYNNYGAAFEKKGQLDKALEFYQKALIANVPSFEDSLDLSECPIGSDYLSPNFLIESFLNKIRIFQTQGKDQSILDHVHCADRFIQVIRTNTISSRDQTQLGERFSRLYEYGLETMLPMYVETPTEAGRDLVFEFFEKNKAVALNFGIKENSAREYLDFPKEMMNELDSLKQSIEKSKTLVLKRSNDSLRTVLFEYERAYEDLIKQMEKDFPNFYAFKYDFSIPTISEVQSSLDEQSAILEYFVGEKALYLSIITASGVYFFEEGDIQNLKDDVIEFREAITSKSDSYSLGSNQLYNAVFSKADSIMMKESLTSATIIYDGILTLLPFELLDEQHGFLINRYVFSYANSLSLATDNSLEQSLSDELISYAPEFDAPNYLTSVDIVRGALSGLPGAMEEVIDLNDVFEGSTVVKKEATEASFKQRAGDFGLIHLATHAIIDDENPDNSRLVFSITDTLEEDGYLHAYEIYNLDLHAQLVTLSACNTGFGKVLKGEGVMSLSRAFAYAGVPATVVSLWPASDKTTPELMKHFYHNLREGQTKDVALNNARKTYLSTAAGKARHPFYWGGFVLIGDTNRIQFHDRNVIWWSMGALFLLTLGFVATRVYKMA